MIREVFFMCVYLGFPMASTLWFESYLRGWTNFLVLQPLLTSNNFWDFVDLKQSISEYTLICQCPSQNLVPKTEHDTLDVT